MSTLILARRLLDLTGDDLEMRRHLKEMEILSEGAIDLSGFPIEKMRNEVVELYAAQFTEAELRPVIEFYESESGQAWLKKSPELTRAAMQIGAEYGSGKRK